MKLDRAGTLQDRAHHCPLCRNLGTEVVFTGSIIVAWNPQVQRIAYVSTKLDLVIAPNLRPVVDKLNLLLALCQWAVAASDCQGRRQNWRSQDPDPPLAGEPLYPLMCVLPKLE